MINIDLNTVVAVFRLNKSQVANTIGRRVTILFHKKKETKRCRYK